MVWVQHAVFHYYVFLLWVHWVPLCLPAGLVRFFYLHQSTPVTVTGFPDEDPPESSVDPEDFIVNDNDVVAEVSLTPSPSRPSAKKKRKTKKLSSRATLTNTPMPETE